MGKIDVYVPMAVNAIIRNVPAGKRDKALSVLEGLFNEQLKCPTANKAELDCLLQAIKDERDCRSMDDMLTNVLIAG